LATVERREPASSDRLPVHRSESPIGYSSAGCSPAEPASASPVTDNSRLNPDPARQSNALLKFTTGMQSSSRSSCPSPTGCYFYFARRVTFLSCADTNLDVQETESGGKSGALSVSRRPRSATGERICDAGGAAINAASGDRSPIHNQQPRRDRLWRAECHPWAASRQCAPWASVPLERWSE
jgi:hypothetical protein